MFSPDNTKFSTEEQDRYARQIALPSLGVEGQKKLKQAKVAVVGAGGLGAPLLQYLAAAGVGTIGIFDFDKVETSNLQRQVLYAETDVGKQKAEVTGERLRAINPHIKIDVHDTKITPNNAVSLFDSYDLVAEGSDNFLTKYVVNDACLILDIPLVFGSIYQFEGQVSVFNYVDEKGLRGPEYRDFFPNVPEQGFIPNCAQAGVMGALPGIVGSMQAMEMIKIITGIGEVLSGSMLVVDALNMDVTKMQIPINPEKKTVDKELVQKRLTALAEINEQKERDSGTDISEISAEKLQDLMQQQEDVVLVDVRTVEEHQSFNIGGELFPLQKLIDTDTLPKIFNEDNVILYCETGVRSSKAIEILRQKFDTQNLLNLKGGMSAWRMMEG
ncbi:molybdopterin-synthase adenylyltransferase MoeB [Gracilimonas mengyeensis]|uniref:Molybdopterin-synthase adenylyltransferase n=1 Tax=Gracilimonas mengyeensis TaxID=1302730 RepID=A0A521BKR6_9BACT|nr:molybdopterin-synthase adenylyltransferase MoeB [Gracilimonas mengyeensis]SMO47713.1 adenylyltransferase and sulfurtransferase [Gracilimonas mengyeensis]